MVSQDEIRRGVATVLSRDGVAAVYLYGSFAEGKEHTGSDIDIGILVADPDAFDFSTVAALERELTQAFGRKADLQVLNDRNPRFLYNVLRNSERLQVNDEAERRRFEYRVMQTYLDMKPFYDKYDAFVQERVTG